MVHIIISEGRAKVVCLIGLWPTTQDAKIMEPPFARITGDSTTNTRVDFETSETLLGLKITIYRRLSLIRQ